MQRIGFYPGTFDPLHDGHIAFALESAKKCKLDTVVFLPETMPRNKVNVTPVANRIKQIQIVIEPHSTLQVPPLKSRQFTISETFAEIQSLFSNAHLTLLVGSDVALGLGKWKDIGVLLSACDIAIGMRSNQTETEITNIITQLKALHPPARTTIVHTTHPSLASSLLRHQIKKPG